jgi:hypothetical protein
MFIRGIARKTEKKKCLFFLFTHTQTFTSPFVDLSDRDFVFSFLQVVSRRYEMKEDGAEVLNLLPRKYSCKNASTITSSQDSHSSENVLLINTGCGGLLHHIK